MNDHPTALTAERRRATPPDTDAPRREMQELVERSSLGSPAARSLRALADGAGPDGRPADRRPVPAPTSTGSIGDTEWMARGSCASSSPVIFHAVDGPGVEAARRICQGCPVKEQCLDHALTHRIDHGVWGGTSERERRQILRRRGVPPP